MLSKNVSRWPRRLFIKKISLVLIVSSTCLLMLVAGLSYYGMKVGDFVIGVEDEVRGYITLSENGDFEKYSMDGLRAEGLNDAMDTTYGYIPKDIAEGYGSKNDKLRSEYMAYSFYAKNISQITVNYEMSINIKDVTKGIDSVIRLMVIREREGVTDQAIYAKPKANGAPEEHLNPSLDSIEPYTTTMFVSPTKVCLEKNESIQPNVVTKYTVVMWLEGEDEQCVDSIKGGSIKLEMKFSVFDHIQ